MKLISMVEYVQQENASDKFKQGNIREGVFMESWNSIAKYSLFLQRPLELGFFVPCKDGVVLEEPEAPMPEFAYEDEFRNYQNELDEYQEAKDRVLFEGCIFEVARDGVNWILGEDKHIVTIGFEGKTIEILCKKDLTLTPKALEQL